MAARSSRRQRQPVVLLRTTALSIIAVFAVAALIVTSSMNYSKLQSFSFVVINNNNNIQNTIVFVNITADAASPSSSMSNQTTTVATTSTTEKIKENSDHQQQQVVRLEFVHIPKTGGTSIEKAALASRHKIRWGIKQIATRSNRTHRRAQPLGDLPYWHAPPTYFRDPSFDPYGTNIFENTDENNNNNNNTDTNNNNSSSIIIRMFTVVRNPYARAVSEYQYWFRDVKRQPNVLYNVDHMNAWLEGMLQPLYDVLKKKKKEKNDTASTSSNGGDSVYKTIDTSNQWRHWRNHQTDDAAFRTAYYANLGHFIPQYDFCYDGLSPQPIIHHVLRFENLAHEFHALMHQYNLTGIRIANTKLQKTQTLKRLRQQVKETTAAVRANNNNNDIDKNATLVAVAARAAAELAQYTRPKVGVANLTLANRQLIQDIYARDFVAFGYKI